MSDLLHANIYGNFVNRRFCDVFPDETTFIEDYKSIPLYANNNKISDESVNVLFYLLYARYGNSVIASFDENQFKFKVFSTIFMYGPSWEKRLEIQSTLRSLTEEDIIRGSKRINNVSMNPSIAPTTDTLEELTTINQQITDGWKKSKLEGYANLMALVNTDVTEEFIGKFKKLFITVVQPNTALWYSTDKEDLNDY